LPTSHSAANTVATKVDVCVCGLTSYRPLHEHPFCLVCENTTLLVFESSGYLWPNRNYSSRYSRNKLSSLVLPFGWPCCCQMWIDCASKMYNLHLPSSRLRQKRSSALSASNEQLLILIQINNDYVCNFFKYCNCIKRKQPSRVFI